MFIVRFPLGEFKRLIQPIKEKQIFLFRVIRNDNHVTDNPRKDLIHLNIGLQGALGKFCDTRLDKRCGLGDQIVG